MIRENEYSVSENYPQELFRQKIPPCLLDKQEQIVDLNLLLKQNWKCFENSIGLQLTARLDPLPFVEGNEKQWHFVIDGLLSMIKQHPPEGNFFLYIKCEPLSVSTSNVRLKKGFRNFQINFKTNITVDESWYKLYHDKLNEIALTVSALKGSFYYNCDKGKGYLFSIVLPGKQD
jgi:hypothetical protein